MKRVLYDHRRVLFGLLFAAIPLLFVAAFRWQDALVGLMAILSALLILKAGSIALAVGVRHVLR